MRGPKPAMIVLTVRQRDLLQQIIRRQTASQQLVRRARLILLATSSLNNSQIGDKLHLDRSNVRTWRQRWLDAAAELLAIEAELDDKVLTTRIEALLADEPRPGTPPTFSAEQVVHIIAIACEKPEDSNRPISHWTAREVADEAQQRGVVTSISARSVGRFLKAGRFTPA